MVGSGELKQRRIARMLTSGVPHDGHKQLGVCGCGYARCNAVVTVLTFGKVVGCGCSCRRSGVEFITVC